ncbi:MAG: family 10 glycosylhydrolase, partial [Planctomycetota bacterium]
STPPILISTVAPSAEGVYEFEFKLEPVWFRNGFGNRQQSVSRKLQFPVVSNRVQIEDPGIAGPSQVRRFSPIQTNEPPSRWRQFQRWSRDQRSNVLMNESCQKVERNGTSMLELKPGGWVAIPIEIESPGKPHTLGVNFIGQNQIAMGCSLLEPDSEGQIPVYGFDSGVYLPYSLVKDEYLGINQRHQMLVWPKSRRPYLLVSNRHAESSVVVGEVEVSVGIHDSESGETYDARKPTRRKMAFYESPLFAQDFGVVLTRQHDSEASRHDWSFFYEGAKRFIKFLKSQKYKGALLTVARDGSSIYPSDLIRPTQRFDNGMSLGNGEDPIRKDVLELLLRMFEREGLELVPVFDLSFPLPNLERGTSEKSAAGIVSSSGDLVNGQDVSGLPIYNPLDQNVNHEVAELVREFLDRYQDRVALSGIGITCHGQSYTMLPGRFWIYDEQTLRRFLLTKIGLDQLPNSEPKMRELIMSQFREEWFHWRAERLTTWYEQLASEISSKVPGGKLFVAPLDFYQHEELSNAMAPSIGEKSEFSDVMKSVGFQRRLIQGMKLDGTSNHTVFLNPTRIAPDESLVQRKYDVTARNSERVRQYFSDPEISGELLLTRASWAHFEQLQQQSPFGTQRSQLLRLQPMQPLGKFLRQRFAETIHQRDSRLLVDGGWILSSGRHSETDAFFKVFNQLPDAKFEDIHSGTWQPADEFPVVVRQLKQESSYWFYAVNSSPWPVKVKLWAQTNDLSGFHLSSLSSVQFVRKNSINQASTGKLQLVPLEIEIEPFGLVGGFSESGIEGIADFDFEFPAEAEQVIRKQIYAMQAKLIDSQNSGTLEGLNNPDFENEGEIESFGWDRGEQAKDQVTVTETPAFGEDDTANLSLLMENSSNGPVWVRSNPFPAPVTGRLSLSVWLKTDSPDRQPPIRLSVEAQNSPTEYYRFGSIGSLSPQPEANQLEGNWKRFAVHFDDVPANPETRLRVGLDLMGPGRVFVDQVEIFDRWFDGNDAKAVTQILASTGPLLARKNTLDRCRRLITNYWGLFLDEFLPVKNSDSNQ